MQLLTRRETQILTLLADGYNYKKVREKLGLSASCLHIHCYNIRQKTGIPSTTDPAACRSYLAQQNPQRVEATPMQRAVLQLLAQGLPYRAICTQLGISLQTAQSHAYLGCRRLGIKSSGQQRLQDIRAALAPADLGMSDPMFN